MIFSKSVNISLGIYTASYCLQTFHTHFCLFNCSHQWNPSCKSCHHVCISPQKIIRMNFWFTISYTYLFVLYGQMHMQCTNPPRLSICLYLKVICITDLHWYALTGLSRQHWAWFPCPLNQTLMENNSFQWTVRCLRCWNLTLQFLRDRIN